MTITVGLQKRDFLMGVRTVWWESEARQAGQLRSLAEACVLSGGQGVSRGVCEPPLPAPSSKGDINTRKYFVKRGPKCRVAWQPGVWAWWQGMCSKI